MDAPSAQRQSLTVAVLMGMSERALVERLADREPLRIHELESALALTRRRSALGADGITCQKLRNLAEPQRVRLLEQFNFSWSTGVLPKSWMMAVMNSNPASGTSTVVATLEDARGSGYVAMLLLLYVQSAFDRLPNEVIEAAQDCLGVTGCLWGSMTAFLVGGSFRVRVGKVLSDARDITSVVPQGSMLSPFLFNLAMAGHAAALPADSRYPICCAIYADDVALWVPGPRRSIASIRGSLQRALEAVISFSLALASPRPRQRHRHYLYTRWPPHATT
ncbi:uncharacterized protein LOC142578305 [Dermacentor variabilis]|uniref:uncharacterized protein LOC142578305 n=1 Tax=Dermacentor variabilis TaxID=34621 RepID=UPI003F5C0EC9